MPFNSQKKTYTSISNLHGTSHQGMNPVVAIFNHHSTLQGHLLPNYNAWSLFPPLPLPGAMLESTEHPPKGPRRQFKTPVAYGCSAGQKFNLPINAMFWGVHDPQPQQRCKSRSIDTFCWLRCRSVSKAGERWHTRGGEACKTCCLHKDRICHIPFVLLLE